MKAGLRRGNLGARVPDNPKITEPGCGIVIALPSARGQNLVYEYGPWQIDLGRRELRLDGVAVPIGARAFEIMQILVQSANELVTKNDILSGVWPGAIVGENTIQVHISAIRKALGSDRAILKTTSGRGYRLLGRWTVRENVALPDAPATSFTTPGPPDSTNLPQETSALIGRAAAARELRDLLSAYRIVTLTGPGGIGKTALALKVARGLMPRFADGGWSNSHRFPILIWWSRP
jgi:DNA-binding winged helix-turn-helix (wHTH) protein